MVEHWMIFVGLGNLSLFFVGLVFFLPKKLVPMSLLEYYKRLCSQFPYLLIILGVVACHLIEVHLIDSVMTEVVGINFAASFQLLENGVVHWFAEHSLSVLVYIFVVIYIIVYPFTLWFTPLSFVLTGQKQAMKVLTFGLLLIYVIALPFYLFFPITNVYSFYGSSFALETVIPSIEQFFYSATTTNNCFPSLHVAVTLLIARSVAYTTNKRYLYFTWVCAGAVIISVIYLAIHWIIDVLGGLILAWSAFYMVKRFIKED
jgi:membrane-associated phospholipid phosphatase